MKKWMGCAVAVMLVINGYSDDWAAWRGPSANGISNERGWNSTAMKVGWTKELGAGYSSVSVKGDRLYTMGHAEGEDTVYCLNAKTGEEVWVHPYPCETGRYKGPRATPVVDGANLYTTSRAGKVICLDAASGKVKWTTDVLEQTGNGNLRWGMASSPVIEGNLLLLNVGEAGVALEKTTGDIVWKSTGTSSYATPVVFDHKGGRCAAIFSAPGLQIVAVDTGKKLASYEWKTKYDVHGADPLVVGDQIFISSGYDHGCALLDFSSGKLKKVWENDLMKNQFSSSVFIDGYIYGIDGQTKRKGYLRCIDAKDGSEAWSMRIGFGSLIAADGKLIALGESGTLYVADASPDKYNEISQMETGLRQLCWTPPVLANGMIYCRNDKGTLVAIDATQ